MGNVNKIILSSDIGKFDTKMIGRNLKNDKVKEICFRTKMYELAKGDVDSIEGNSYKVIFENNEYIVGEQGSDKSSDTSKTNFLHKLCAYTSITQFIEPNTKNDIYMVLACPLSVLQIQSAKEEYKEFIKSNKEINIEVNGKQYSFIIKEVMIKAEGSGILYLNKDMFIDKDVAVVDLGGLNMGFSFYRNGVCKKEDRFIEELGVNNLVAKVREQLMILKGGNLITTEQAEKALNKGYLPKHGDIDSESIDKIKTAKAEYFDAILKAIREHGYKIEDMDKVVFVGGTSQKILDNISAIKHSYVPNSSNMTTVEGLYKIAFGKWGQQ